MFDWQSYPRRMLLAGGALGLALVTAWGSFAYVAVSSRHRIGVLTAERDAAVAERGLLREKAGQLAELEARIGAARAEHGRAVQALADTRARTAAAQEELAAAPRRRLDPTADRASQTGSIRPSEPPKRPAR